MSSLARSLILESNRDQSESDAKEGVALKAALLAGQAQIVEAVLRAREQLELRFEKHESKRQQRLWDVMLTLRFPDMQTRQDAIGEAFPATYDWALDEDISGLRSWLLTGSDTYWITGKAGSGKSTLMKFLSNDPRTRKYLTRWSGDSEDLVVIQCYFWYLGSILQKSIEGLLRTIAYHILSTCPQVVETLLPERWKLIQTRRDIPQPSWTLDELQDLLLKAPKAIFQARQASNAPKSLKCCLFVDGLDEYNGNHGRLVHILNDLAATDGMKICVSSRPWNVFVRAYESRKPHLFLHELTADDIRLYVNSKIMGSLSSPATYDSRDSSCKDLQAIVSDVVSRAEGVFLWVYLAVQSVLRGFDEGDSISTLHQRVLTFPTDLRLFFDNILARVDTVYHHHTTQALYLAYLYAKNHDEAAVCSSYLDFELISRNSTGVEDPQYLWALEPQAYSPEEIVSLIRATRKFLSACCKDLLIVDIPRTQRYIQTCAADPARVKVQFLHRTVFEYLQRSSHRQWLEEAVPQCFKDKSVFHLLNAAKLKIYCSDVPKECVPKYFNRQCQFSLGRNWPGLDVAFIDRMHACRPFHQATPCAIIGAAYISFQQFDTFRSEYTLPEPCQRKIDKKNTITLRPLLSSLALPEARESIIYLQLLAATLGVSDCRHFPYQEVDVDLLDIVMSGSTNFTCEEPWFREAESEILLKFLRGSLPSLIDLSVVASEDTILWDEFVDGPFRHMHSIVQLLMRDCFSGMKRIFRGDCPLADDGIYDSLWQRLTSAGDEAYDHTPFEYQD